MKPIVSVLIQLSWQTGPQMDILRGIREYMRLRSNWTLRSNTWPDEIDTHGQSAIILTKSLPDGSVSMPRFKGPVVSVVDCGRADVVVERDNDSIGVCAANHLLELGFKHLAYILPDDTRTPEEFSEARWRGFNQTIQAAGLTAEKATHPMRHWPRKSSFIAWLGSLPKPCGVFCANDYAAMELLAMARSAGIRVPEELAVVGADNMDIWCETSIPPLTSVSIPWRKVGYLAAEWVDLLLQGHPAPPGRRVLVQHGGIVTRQSTDIVSIANPILSRALAHIRMHACEGITVKELLATIPGDRRQLYRMFEHHLGRTPHEEIRRIQLEKARQLLTHTDLTLPLIAKEVGLSDIYFINNFRKATGLTPGAYRRQQRSDMGIPGRPPPSLRNRAARNRT